MTILNVISGIATTVFPIAMVIWVRLLSKRLDLTNARIDASDKLADLRARRS